MAVPISVTVYTSARTRHALGHTVLAVAYKLRYVKKLGVGQRSQSGELDGVGYLLGQPRHVHAPSATVATPRRVHLQRHHRVAGRAEELGTVVRPHDDSAVDEGVGQRTPADRPAPACSVTAAEAAGREGSTRWYASVRRRAPDAQPTGMPGRAFRALPLTEAQARGLV